MRIGQGFDSHALAEGRPLWLGGVQIPHDRGLVGHSDGDALLHAITSALLGALGEGDLGSHFPSSDTRLEGIASAHLLEQVLGRMRSAGFEIGNLDATVIAEQPRLAPHLEKMRASVADLTGSPLERINIKASSSDGLGAIGRGEGIASLAVVLLLPKGEGT